MQTILTLCNNSSNAGMDRIRWKHAGKMSVSAEGNKERLIRGDTFELKLEKMSGNLSSRQEESRRHSRQAEAGTRRAEGIQAGGSRYTPSRRHPGRRKPVPAEQKASRQAEAGTRRAEGIQAGGSRYTPSRRHPGRRKPVHAEQKASRQAEAGTRRAEGTPGRRKPVHAEQKAFRQAEAGTRQEVRTGRVGSILSTRGRLISGASSTRGRRETAREEAGLAGRRRE